MKRFRTAVTVAAAILAAACSDQQATGPRPEFAPGGGGGGGGGPTVTATDPTYAPQDTTLDVRVLGSGFDRGSRADFALGGVVGPKVRTNSTRFVSSKELVANVTIALDAETGLYDAIVTTSTGKKGIGTEMFEVRPRNRDNFTVYPEIVFASGTGGLAVVDFDGSNRAVLSADPWPKASWAATGSGTAADPWHVVMNTDLSCNPTSVVRVDVGVVGGQVQAFNRQALTASTHACDPAWSPVADTILFAEGAMVGPSHLYLMSASGGPQTAVYATPGGDHTIYWPAWSPDGSRIAFVEEPLDDVNNPAVKVLDRRTGTVTTVVAPGTFSVIRGIDWARTRDALAFSGVRLSGGFETVYTLELTPLGAPVEVVRGRGPTWSPGDSKLVYEGAGRIVQIDLGTRKTKTLAGDGSWPDWRR